MCFLSMKDLIDLLKVIITNSFWEKHGGSLLKREIWEIRSCMTNQVGVIECLNTPFLSQLERWIAAKTCIFKEKGKQQLHNTRMQYEERNQHLLQLQHSIRKQDWRIKRPRVKKSAT
ncbi:uncharacterized protein LOC129291667 isoform X2 [Prosopis cineraria]|uniref:uncharacterized protein LOC129291667 isoform X2 n=1 Tax=Prosopis cineraria TaxID=364024 RepID=UPI002410395F|nr:uncharacterized protein LOC129291667 isoform X2 [Prosopis cineraria]